MRAKIKCEVCGQENWIGRVYCKRCSEGLYKNCYEEELENRYVFK